MKHWLITAFVLVLVAGCGGQDAPDRQAEPSAPKADPFPFKTQAEVKQQEEQAAATRAKERSRLLEQVRSTFKPQDEKPAWLAELSAGTSVFDQVNRDVERFHGIRSALVTTQSISDFSWDEIGMTEEQARKELRTAGLQTVKELVAVYANSIDQRGRAGHFGRGEGAREFMNGVDVMNEITYILVEAHAEPKDVGQSPASLRAVLILDLRMYLAWTRKLAAVDLPLVSTDRYGSVLYAIERAQQEYGVSLQELGLTKEELAMLNARSRG